MKLKDVSDEALVEQVKAGSMPCFQELYDRYKVRIYSYLYQILRNKEQAEDCAHDVFILLFNKANLYSPKSKFSSWLYKIAKNMALDLLRKNKVRKSISLDEELEKDDSSLFTLHEMLENPDAGPSQIAQSEEMKALLQKAIEQLSEEERQVITLCDIQGLPHQEVSEIIGAKPKTVAVKLFRARKKLAEILKIKTD